MTRLRSPITLGLVLFLLLSGCRERQTAAPEAPGPRRLAGAAKGWNVLLVSIDTLRADRLGAYGYRAHPTSPHLDELLGSGVRFARAAAPRASTWPSLASVLTGLYPSAHGVAENGYSFPDDLPTLPRILHGAGYRTGAFLSNMCRANHRGWDAFNCTAGNDGKAVRNALAWAETLPADKPWFLWLHLFGAHSPYYNGGDAATRLNPGYDGPLGPKRWKLDRVMTERLALTPRDVQHLDALYAAAVQGSDRRVGDLLAGLRPGGRLDRTLIVFLADHGEELYDHNGYLYHACSVYETTLHVPLGFAAPGLLPAGAVPQTVELIDVLPTVLGLLGLPPPAEQHGRSLLPYLERPGAGGEGKPAFSEYGAAPVHTVVQGNWKLVHNPAGFTPECIPDAPPGHYPIGRAELYDLASDPGETRNLAASEPARVAALAQLIRRRFAGLTNRTRDQDIPEDLRQELKALGYAAH